MPVKIYFMPTLKEIQEFLENVSKLDLHKVELKSDEYKLTVQFKPDNEVQQIVSNYTRSENIVPTLEKEKYIEIKQENSVSEIKQEIVNTNLIIVKSPMVGTFYRRPKPDQPTYVEVGSKIKEGDILCIIEAMKLFNEIESEISGEIVEITAKDGSPVEYDQPLFLVKPL